MKGRRNGRSEGRKESREKGGRLGGRTVLPTYMQCFIKNINENLDQHFLCMIWGGRGGYEKRMFLYASKNVDKYERPLNKSVCSVFIFKKSN